MLCSYCGEAEGKILIPDPNYCQTTQPDWLVCLSCKELIAEQKLEAIKTIIEHTMKRNVKKQYRNGGKNVQ